MQRLIFTLLMLAMYTAYSQELDLRIKNANEEYTKGNYVQAVGLYKQVVDEGSIAPELYYNLANAYFKNNQVSQAILNYERALKLKPDDEDVKFNLQMANLKIIDKMDAIPQLFFKTWWDNVKNLLSMDGWAWLGLISFFLTLLLFSFYLLSAMPAQKRIFFFVSLAFLFLSIAGFVFAQKQFKLNHEAGEAIVTTPTVVIKGSPAETGVDLFVIHEGLKVVITENINDWYQIKLPNGSQGWLKTDAVEII